jgi:HK97 family phage prohead protease
MTMTEAPPARAETPPRQDLLRMAPFALRAEGDADGDGLTLDGYAAVFNRESIIDSWEGKFREKISPGSMKKSFREKPPRIQFDHGRHPLVGSIPIASVQSVREETDPELAPDGGAHVVGRLHDNWLVEPVRDAIRSESIDGMSFRFSVVRETWYDADGKQIRDEDTLHDLLRRTWFEDVPDDELLLRDLRELKVPELGPVVWPAYEETSVEVRSEVITIDMGHLDDPEQRKTLARAVFLADAAERMTADDAPQATEENSAGERDEPVESGEPQATEENSAGEHPSSEDETPRSTVGDQTPAGEHDTAERHSDSGATPEMKRSSWYLPADDEQITSVI